MSTELTFKSKQPESGDSGASSVFADLEFNIQKNDRHNHNGIESTKLSIAAINVSFDTIAKEGWSAADANGLSSQTITLPAALTKNPLTSEDETPGELTFDDISMEFRLLERPRDPLSGTPLIEEAQIAEVVYPKVERASDTTYIITVNDSSIDLRVIYTT